MMRQSQTAVLEKNTTFNDDFSTEPYEVAWASEARWFVQVLSTTHPDTQLEVRTQLSPDGLTWCDHDDVRTIGGTGLTSWPVREFGQWLRLRGTVKATDGAADELASGLAPADDTDASAKVRIYLVAKS